MAALPEIKEQTFIFFSFNTLKIVGVRGTHVCVCVVAGMRGQFVGAVSRDGSTLTF